ncbi:Insulin-like growth factor-binding protein complex acid labile subunit [Orchesella cincta]|uniref:Insulin-like growth factor-binding protein complex acid labile subunit n=1 Tax=Orchesella cincta TaxID=48709 RepID=A0A1D2NHC0_ORCCI|nr:Insulin-like growth factor-binding protein complex acid labile subunit [Orchesella cincta]
MEPTSSVSVIATLVLGFLTVSTLAGYIPPGPKYKCPDRNLIWPCVCPSTSDDGLTLKCEEVSMATLAAAMAYARTTVTPIESLQIFNLNTEKLYGKLFSGVNITSIRIENSPISFIGPDIFFPLRNTLLTLELIGTRLQTYPNDAFESLESLVTLTLDHHNISSLDPVITGLGSLKNLQISNGNISSFQKATFSARGKLLRLDLHGNQLTTIPKDAFQNLKNLEYLDVAWNHFDKLDPGYFFHLSRLTWFNASHNEIPEFKRGAFARNGFLRVIYLTHNKMAKIDAAAFRGMRLLTRLYLSDNQIADVGRGAFNSLQRIKTIDLARNKLKLVDYQMFMKLPFAEELIMSENEITKIKQGAFQELAYCVVNMSHNQISMIEKQSFENCVNMTVLDMSHNLIDNFTKAAFDENSYPNEWRLEYNKLKLTGDIPLKFMAGIKILNVSHNELREVNKNTFPKLYEMHTVDLSWNNISKIHSAVFINLFSLRNLNMSHNSLTDLSGSAFGAVPTLLDLNLDHNNLTTVSNAAFSRMASLRELSVANNRMKKVFQISGSLNGLNLANNEITSLSKAWPTMNALQRLDLSGNQLGGNLPGGAFDNLGALSKISLADNNITEVPADALSTLTTIQYIDLSKNALVNLSRAAFGRLPIVFELLLSQNQINSIEPRAFDGMLQLLHLDLSQNDLKSIPMGAFSALNAMRILNLSRNSIERTDNSTNSLFEEALSLLTLDLSHNKISSIHAHTFPELRWTKFKLDSIDLSHNNLMIIKKEILKGTKTVTKLNLSRNKITEIKMSVLGNMTTLQDLDLSHNELSFLDATILGPPPALKSLNLEGNYLRKFPTEVLNKAPFNYLNLGSNRIKLFNVDFVPKIKNGSRIILKDNPIACDCRLIFLKRHFQELRPKLTNFSQEYFQDFHDFKCKGAVDTVENMEENELICDYLEDPFSPKIPINYDVEIRSLSHDGQNLDVKWRVKSKMDILGFQLELLDDIAGSIVDTETFSYTERMSKTPLKGKTADRVCLVPKYSSDDGLTPNQKVNKVCHKLENIVAESVYGKGSSGVKILHIFNLILVGILVKLF